MNIHNEGQFRTRHDEYGNTYIDDSDYSDYLTASSKTKNKHSGDKSVCSDEILEDQRKDLKHRNQEVVDKTATDILRPRQSKKSH